MLRIKQLVVVCHYCDTTKLKQWFHTTLSAIIQIYHQKPYTGLSLNQDRIIILISWSRLEWKLLVKRNTLSDWSLFWFLELVEAAALNSSDTSLFYLQAYSVTVNITIAVCFPAPLSMFAELLPLIMYLQLACWSGLDPCKYFNILASMSLLYLFHKLP